MNKLNFFNVFTRDFSLKIVALACAFGLWLAASAFGSHTITVNNITPDVVNMPAGMGLGEEIPKISVKLRVPRTVSLERLEQQNEIRAFIDLKNSGLGEKNIPVNVTTNSSNTDVVAVMPDFVSVTLDPVVEREISVRVVPEGSPADGFKIGEIRVEPSKVKIRAPLGAFRNLTSGVDAKADVTGTKSDFETMAMVQLPNGARTETEQVKIRVSIEQSAQTKNVGLNVKTKGAIEAGYFIKTITTSPQTVNISGIKDLIDPLVLIDTEELDIQGLRADKEFNVKLLLPEGVKTGLPENTVRAKIEVDPLEGTKEFSAAVTVNNVPEGLQVSSISPASLKVSVRGNDADKLRDENVRVVINAEGRGAGSFTIRPEIGDVRVEGQSRAVSIEQREVTVRLES